MQSLRQNFCYSQPIKILSSVKSPSFFLIFFFLVRYFTLSWNPNQKVIKQDSAMEKGQAHSRCWHCRKMCLSMSSWSTDPQLWRTWATACHTSLTHTTYSWSTRMSHNTLAWCTQCTVHQLTHTSLTHTMHRSSLPHINHVTSPMNSTTHTVHQLTDHHTPAWRTKCTNHHHLTQTTIPAWCTTQSINSQTNTHQPIAQNAQVTDHRQLSRTITSMTTTNKKCTQFINSHSITGLLLLSRSPSKQNKFFLLLQSPVGHKNCQPHLEVFSGPDGWVTQGQVAWGGRQLPLVQQSVKNAGMLPGNDVLAGTMA